jgi:hypothetical protein
MKEVVLLPIFQRGILRCHIQRDKLFTEMPWELENKK